MIKKISSAHISAEGDVVVLIGKKSYVYAQKLTDSQAKKLLKKLGQIQEINLMYWIEEIDIGITDE